MFAWMRIRALPWIVWGGAIVGAGALWVDIRLEFATGFTLGPARLATPDETLVPDDDQRVVASPDERPSARREAAS